MPNNLSFPYTAVRLTGGQIFHRPLLPIQLSGAGKTIQYTALVDSGADISVMPHNTGLELGLVWEEQVNPLRLGGAVASHETRIIAVKSLIGNLSEVPLIFAWSSLQNIPLVLGQTNFFNRFNITFRLSENLFEITPVDL